MSARSQINDLLDEHGDDLAGKLLSFLPRLIALIKRGRAARITAALDRAHAQVDEMADARRAIAVENEARRARADEPTVTMPLDPNRNGAGHE
jgi:hypothetical protein